MAESTWSRRHYYALLSYSSLSIIVLVILSMLNSTNVFCFTIQRNFVVTPGFIATKSTRTVLFSTSETSGGSTSQSIESGPPLAALNGKRILPYKILFAGLKESTKIPAVYAIVNSRYNKQGDGWDVTEYVGVTQDIQSALTILRDKYGPEQVAYIRALSFSAPQPNAMQEMARQWKTSASQAGAELVQNDAAWTNTVADALSYVYDDDDDDDDDDDEFEDIMSDLEVTSQAMASYANNEIESATVVSPFQRSSDSSVESESAAVGSGTSLDETNNSNNDVGTEMPLTRDNVDKVLDEVRPYLISDGGNVAVERVDESNGNVYLKLEGACGSCPSSTVTMQMGIERILKEKFATTLGQVLQVQDSNEDTSLTESAVQQEMNRLSPAITGMGCSMDLVSIDADTGVVNMKFRGSNKVRQGLELALADLKYVNKVNFIMGDD